MSIYQKQKRYFEAAYRTGEHGWPTVGPSLSVTAFITRFKREREGGWILDIGCGEGRHAAAFARAGYRAVGLDYQPAALARAVSLTAGSGPNLHFVLGELFHLPFPAGRFDVLLDYGCFHHVRKRDTGRYLDCVVPLLRTGGYFLLSCFSTAFKHHPEERRRRDWLVHRGHYDRFFRREDFAAIFGETFRILQVEEEREGIQAFYNVLMRKKGGGRDGDAG